MDVVSILGLGAVGLGFLLAYLSYRLLANPLSKERPIYIFMVFCLALVCVGALLQYNDSRSGSELIQLRKEHENLISMSGIAENALLSAQKGISEMRATLASTQSSLNDTLNENKRLTGSMGAIFHALTPTQQPLQVVANHVTDGGACNGGAHGEPLPHGNEDGARISSALANITAATRIAAQHVPP
jgi:hypothetical protein